MIYGIIVGYNTLEAMQKLFPFCQKYDPTHQSQDEQLVMKRTHLAEFIRKCANQKYQCQEGMRTALALKDQEHAARWEGLLGQLQAMRTQLKHHEDVIEEQRHTILELEKQKDQLENKLKYQQIENERHRKFLKIKENVIDNFEWEKQILLSERAGNYPPQNKLFQRCLEEVGTNRTSFIDQRKKNRSIVIRKNRQENQQSLEDKLANANKLIKELQNKNSMLLIDKEHIESQYKLQLNQRDGEGGEKQQKNLVKKCLLLEEQIQKLSNLTAQELQSKSYVDPPITPHFPTGFARLFFKRGEDKAESTSPK